MATIIAWYWFKSHSCCSNCCIFRKDATIISDWWLQTNSKLIWKKLKSNQKTW